MILVYHANEPTFQVDLPQMRKDFHEGKFTHVADVNTDNKDTAFNLTNHIDTSWQENKNVNPASDRRERSTSIGDIFVCDDAVYAVEGHGFAILHYFDNYNRAFKELFGS